jgi:hypothetical protein
VFLGLSDRPDAGFWIWTSENNPSTTFVNKGKKKGRAEENYRVARPRVFYRRPLRPFGRAHAPGHGKRRRPSNMRAEAGPRSRSP